MKPTAYNMLRKEPEYRASAFDQGLLAAGYTVSLREPRSINPGDVMLLWNRSGLDEIRANVYEKGGGRIIVCENGYIGRDLDGNQYYSVAVGGHNGSGKWYSTTEDRWGALNILLKPWHTGGDHILICPNRQIGPQALRQPMNFTEQVTKHLKAITDRPLRVRPHPGNWQVNPPKIPLKDDLRNAHVCVIWSSSSGVQSLVEGVPVIQLAPKWICRDITAHTLDDVHILSMPDRLPSLKRLAWAQWSLSEIRQGLPFICLQKI